MVEKVEIYRNGALVDGTDLIVIPAGATSRTYTFVAKVIDQYGVEFEHEVEWDTTNNTSGAVCANGVIITATGAAFTVNNETGMIVALQAVAAAYDGDGRLVSLDAVEGSMGAGGNLDLSLTYAENKNVTSVKVFVLNANTREPLTAAWTNS